MILRDDSCQRYIMECCCHEVSDILYYCHFVAIAIRRLLSRCRHVTTLACRHVSIIAAIYVMAIIAVTDGCHISGSRSPYHCCRHIRLRFHHFHDIDITAISPYATLRFYYHAADIHMLEG